MRVLCDTNLLVRSVSEDDPDHHLAVAALAQLRRTGHVAVLVPQCLYEFYAVVTRPTINNGLGIAPQDAVEIINNFLDVMPLLRDERMVFHHWLTLVSDYEVQGKQSHDTRLVAAMDRHHVDTLITFNIRDFQRFTHINIVSPSDLVA